MDLSRYRERFVAESRAHLDEARACLRRLRDGAGGAETIDEVFRHAHSVKGMAATLGYEELATAADALEDLLEMLRNGPSPSEPALDAIERAVGTIERRILTSAALEVELFQGVGKLAARQGKAIELGLRGARVGLDRDLLDALCEPLLHLLLNAVDHGIESPSERVRHGKPGVGSIVVRLDRDAGGVRLSVTDDGRGVDEDAVRRKAIAEGWIPELDAPRLDSDEVLALLTRAGFSMAGADSAISGRGIGLDAVRDAVSRLGGTLSIESRPGRGTTVTMRLPPTVASRD